MRNASKLALLAACACALLAPAAAQAEIVYQRSIGSSGRLGGEFSTPAGISINNANANLYVADLGQNRIEQLNAAGRFVRAWGYDVVASGPDNKPFANETDEVRIRATSGTFSLRFGGEETGQLPFDASASAVEAALNSLAAVNAGGGSVTVSGGPGDAGGSHPYVVAFSGGPLAHQNLELGIEPSGLGMPPGTQLSCEAGTEGGTEGSGELQADEIDYQWLADGAPVAGATSSTFTPGAAEEGKAIQCQVTMIFGSAGTTTASRPYVITAPAPATLPPLGPASLAKPDGKPIVESAGGNALTCQAGSWTRNPETFTYRWYRNGSEIGAPTTTAATSDEYVLTEADVAERAAFQCGVTASNAGGSSTTISAFLESKPAPSVLQATAAVTVAVSGRSSVLTRANGGPVFEVCSGAAGDECKAGVAGPGAGQLSQPRSVAVDNSPSGEHAVYVIDDGNARVQKFSADGKLLLSFGREVNESNGQNVCTVVSGDVCGTGVRAESATAAGFGIRFSTYAFRINLGNDLAVGPSGDVYVGDPRGAQLIGRVQKFDAGGNFLSQAKVPHANLFGSSNPISVTVDSTQRAFVTTQAGAGAGVIRLLPEEFSATGDGTQLAGNLFDQDREAAQLALDPRNDRILVSDFNSSETVSVCGGPAISGQAVLEFDPEMNEIDCSVPTGVGQLPESTGMAVSPAGRLFVSAGPANVIKEYKLPTPTSPAVGTESVTNITTETARVHAQINPGFEATAYEVEYGTEPCPAGGCQVVEGESALHGLKFTDGAVPISGLTPGTTYHYRVIASNPLGEVAGSERTFTTFSRVDLTSDSCPNALARKQTRTAGLLDCRAYELASAAFAGGYDVVSDLVPGQEPFDGYPYASGKLLYGVKDGGIPGAGNPTNRGIDPYVASRDEDGTWHTRYVGIPANDPFATAPFSSTPTGVDASLDTFSFSAPDICSPCFEDGSAGVPVRLPSGELVQGMTGEGSHPSATPDGYVAEPLSPNGEHLIFGSTTRFAEGGNEETGDVSLYDRNLRTGETKVISNSPETEDFPVPLPCLQGAGECHSPGDGNGIAELAISHDGSRILVAQKVAVDAKGNPRWHLYLEIGDSVSSIDLTPGATAGASFDGMTGDGSRVFFTTKDRLLGEDEDESADVYEADVESSGARSLHLVSVNADGTPSNDDSCTPSNEPTSWNAAEAEGKCGALAFAGGAGVAAQNGAFYFLSPEQLDGSEGTASQPNLYAVAPGGTPQFVATIDTSVGKPGPMPATNPLIDAEFGGMTFGAVQALTVDQSTGDVYAFDGFGGNVYRFDETGAPDPFSAGPSSGTNVISGVASSFGLSKNGLAVDNATASPLRGDLYVNGTGGVKVFAPSGEPLGILDGSETFEGEFGDACGVAVDQSSGVLYVGDSTGFIWQYTPSSPTGEITDADYTVRGIVTPGLKACSLAIDDAGHLYAAKSSDGPVYRFPTGGFAAIPPSVTGTEIDANAKALAVNPETNELYVDEGNKISVFDSSGNPTATIGAGKLSCGFLGSRGVAVNAQTHHVYASCFEPSTIKEFGYEVPPFTPVDDPAILNATARPEAQSYGDFQVTSGGRYAIFASSRPLAEGFDNASRYEVYRYDAQAQALTCISCSPSGAAPEGDASLPSHGLGVLEDGRVFFNSPEQLSLADTNGKQDAYEYSGGVLRLISTGTSIFPSSMLGASADGTDAFFFTRDVLVAEDRNGQAMKVYDAREGGGHFVIPPPPPCAASDECHGPGTVSAPPPAIGTFKGTGGQAVVAPAGCKARKVRRHGRCVKPHRKRHRRHGKHHRHKRHHHPRHAHHAKARGGIR